MWVFSRRADARNGRHRGATQHPGDGTSLPVILVTGHATPGEIEQARRLGVTEIVEKPYILNEFHVRR